MAELERRQVDLQLIDQGLDTSTPAGKLIFAVIGAVAEFERDPDLGVDPGRARRRPRPRA
jgi:DNA invertase Pin-like site-specific DNA recombinase